MYELEKYLNTIEFGEVLKLLSNEAGLFPAKEKALALMPCCDYESALFSLKQTEDAYLLTAKFASPSFGSPKDPTGLLARCEMGGTLGIAELLDVADALRTIRVVKEWRSDISSEINTSLDELFSCLFPNKYIEDKIRFAIKNSEELSDSASPKLSDIRRKIRGVSASIKDKLDSIVKSHSRARYLQEAIVTQRDGRFVVPVKAEFKSEVPGIVHDTSSSGATLFIEPMSVVEANNELRVLFSAEREEIERILGELSSEVSTFATAIKDSFKCVIELNLIFAKAALAYKMRATVPSFNNDGKILLKNARHPLIDRKKVVPISLSLGDEYDSLIITGPNTGGKTVTLKTVGLLTVMTMCGMMIPADDGSRISFFDRILVDKGDEQSIEQSLSTFSSHIVNLVKIIGEAPNNSLILLDELGAGTDPVEGAALAKSVLIRLKQLGAKVVATTHYAELKSYALETEGVENASCEFDVETMRPTYKLLLGVPGKSNAFSIAGKLGIDDEVISQAKGFISSENLRFESVVEALQKARQEAERERDEAARLNEEALRLKNEASKSLAEAEKSKEKIFEKAKNDASYIIDDVRYKSNKLLGELEDAKRDLTSTNALDMVMKARESVGKTVRDLENTADPVGKRENENYVLPRALSVGDHVVLFDLGEKAIVEQLSKDGKKALVAIGAAKTWTKTDNLKLIDAPKERPKNKIRNISGVTSKAERDVKWEFDMRGMNSDEGIMELDRYIDSAILSGIPSVTIIHGKGTGVLRAAVHDFLRHHKRVRSFRLGIFGEGESGVTIVEFK